MTDTFLLCALSLWLSNMSWRPQWWKLNYVHRPHTCDYYVWKILFHVCFTFEGFYLIIMTVFRKLRSVYIQLNRSTSIIIKVKILCNKFSADFIWIFYVNIYLGLNDNTSSCQSNLQTHRRKCKITVCQDVDVDRI